MPYISYNENETMEIAKNFAKNLSGGEVILMYGDLGAGKTVFVKGIAQALGVKEIVKSPTFNLMKVYTIHSKFKIQNSKFLLCHIDAYRLKNFDDLLDIGAEEYLGKENVITVIEWAERINIKTLKHSTSLKLRGTGKNIKTKIIKIQHGKKDTERILTIN